MAGDTDGATSQQGYDQPSETESNMAPESEDEKQDAPSFDGQDSDEEAVLNNKIENYENVESNLDLIETPTYLTSFRNKEVEAAFLYSQMKSNERRTLILFIVLVVLDKVELGYYYFYAGKSGAKSVVAPIVLATTVLLEAGVLWLLRTLNEKRAVKALKVFNFYLVYSVLLVCLQELDEEF